jgi:hypothetical protein
MARRFVAASSQTLECTSAPLTAVPLTISFWYRPSTVSGTETMVSLTASSGATNGFSVWRFSGNLQAYTNAASSASHSGTLTVGRWVHVAATWTGTTSRIIYYNSDPVTDTTSVTAPAGINRFNVGCHFQSGSRVNYASSDIAEVAIWAEALTAYEIRMLTQWASPVVVRPQSLRAYLPLSDAGYVVERDRNPYSTGRYNMTVTNSPQITTLPVPVDPVQPCRRRLIATSPGGGGGSPAGTALTGLSGITTPGFASVPIPLRR